MQGLVVAQARSSASRIPCSTANNNTTSYTYDKRNLRLSENRLLAAITKFKRDAMGDVVQTTDPESRITTTAYDKRRRIVAVTTHAGQTTQTAYDGNGNKTAVTTPLGRVTSYEYDGANRLTKVTPGKIRHAPTTQHLTPP